VHWYCYLLTSQQWVGPVLILFYLGRDQQQVWCPGRSSHRCWVKFYFAYSYKRLDSNLCNGSLGTYLSKHELFSADQVYRFKPPKLNTEKSNIKNSENTTLFNVSCFQYVLSGIVLSVGPPFRQSMRNNRKRIYSDITTRN